MVKSKRSYKRKNKKFQQVSVFENIQEFFKIKYISILKRKKSYSKKFFNYYKKFVNYFKTNEKINSIKEFFLIISGYGFLVNYALHFIFGLEFNLFTLFAWGISYYFIKDEFVEWFRRLIEKR